MRQPLAGPHAWVGSRHPESCQAATSTAAEQSLPQTRGRPPDMRHVWGMGRRRQRAADRMTRGIPGGNAPALEGQDRSSRVVQGTIGYPFGPSPRLIKQSRSPQHVQAAQRDPGVGRILPQCRNLAPQSARVRPRVVRGPGRLQQCLGLAIPIAQTTAHHRPAAE